MTARSLETRSKGLQDRLCQPTCNCPEWDCASSLADIDHPIAGTVQRVVLRWPPAHTDRRTDAGRAGGEEHDLTVLLGDTDTSDAASTFPTATPTHAQQ